MSKVIVSTHKNNEKVLAIHAETDEQEYLDLYTFGWIYLNDHNARTPQVIEKLRECGISINGTRV